MLYNYPPSATSGNWLHWCLAQILMRVHRDLELNQSPPNWPQLIPDDYREKLKRRHELRDKLKAYTAALESLSTNERQSVLETLVRQNEIRRVLSGRRTCNRIDALPLAIREPAKHLFEFAFKILSDLEIRDTHYRTIFNTSRDKVCPFCGLEYFEAPGGKREAYDHFLPKSHYPFAAANLWNLVPMGHKCNSLYKGTNDPLVNDTGIRRRALNPYGSQCFTVSLAGTVMTEAPDEIEFTWKVVIEPAIEEAETWDALFDIRTRYQRDILKYHWEKWLQQFADFAKEKGVSDDVRMREALSKYCLIQRNSGLDGCAFLKAAFYEVVLTEIDSGNEAIRRILHTITGIM